MEYHSLVGELRNKKLSPVYFFFGEESYPIETIIKMIVETGTNPDVRSFNCDILQGEETDGESVVLIASSYPMMSEHRVVVVKSIQRFSPSDRKRIIDYIQSPLESTCLVMTAGKIDRRQSFFSALIAHAKWMECKPLYENQAVEWVKKEMKDRGVVLSDEGAMLLVQQAGTSLWNLKNEIEKLITFAWGKFSLDLKDVAPVVGFSRKYNIWDLAEAVGEKDLPRALHISEWLIEERQSPVGMLMELTRGVLLLMRIQAMLNAGYSEEKLTGALKLRPYFVKSYIQRARRFTSEELDAAVQTLLAADLGIKTGMLEPTMAMTLVIVDIVRGRSRQLLFNPLSNMMGNF